MREVAEERDEEEGAQEEDAVDADEVGGPSSDVEISAEDTWSAWAGLPSGLPHVSGSASPSHGEPTPDWASSAAAAAPTKGSFESFVPQERPGTADFESDFGSDAALAAGMGGARLAGAYDTAAAAEPRTAASGATPNSACVIPTDMCWPSQDELAVAAATSSLTDGHAVRAGQQHDPRVPPFVAEMQSVCWCKKRDCLVELWTKHADSEGWKAWKKCEAAEVEVRNIVENNPRRSEKTKVKGGFKDVIGGYAGSNDTARTTADGVGTTATSVGTAGATVSGAVEDAVVPLPRGAKAVHRRSLLDAKRSSNDLAEAEIVRLSKLKLLGPEEKSVCLATLCYLVRRTYDGWLGKRPGHTQQEKVAKQPRRRSRLHRLGLNKYAQRSSMESLCSLEDLPSAECRCKKHCMFAANVSDLHYFRRQVRKAMDTGVGEDMFQVVQEILIHYPGICSHAVHLITGHSPATINGYRQYATLGAFRKAHGNTGRSPWNIAPKWVLAAIRDTLDVCTMKDPESKVRRPVNPTTAGVRKMYEHMRSGNVKTGRTMADLRAAPLCIDSAGRDISPEDMFVDRCKAWCSLSTFARGVAQICRAEGCKLLRAQTGHNKCPYCLEMEQEILTTHAEVCAVRFCLDDGITHRIDRADPSTCVLFAARDCFEGSVSRRAQVLALATEAPRSPRKVQRARGEGLLDARIHQLYEAAIHRSRSGLHERLGPAQWRVERKR
eukprot:COSAG02_NODE_488_length_21256_cov_9.406579_16_plen_722_part_00